MTPAPHCGRLPMLRVRERQYFPPNNGEIVILPYVRYECPVCGVTGGLSITEAEARTLWEP